MRALTILLMMLAGLSRAELLFVDIREATLGETARLLSSLSGHTVTASPGTRELPVEALLGRMSLESALRAICRGAGVVYRQDEDTAVFRILTLEEFQRIPITTGDNLFETRIYPVDSANLPHAAAAIAHLFGSRVLYQQGEVLEDFRNAPGDSADSRGVGSTRRERVQFGDTRRSYERDFLDRDTRRGSSATLEEEERRRVRLTAETALEVERLRAAPESDATGESVRETLAAREPEIHLTVNYEHSLLLARSADRTALNEIGDIVEALNRPVPQVILEMKILQLDVTDGFVSAVNLTAESGREQFGAGERNPVTGQPEGTPFLGMRNRFELGNFASEPGATFAYRFISDQIQGRIELLENDNRVEVIATPLLIATNNRRAQIEVGEERVITVGATSEIITAPLTGAREEVIRVITEQRIIGVTLDLIPRIHADGSVTLSVFQESTTLKPRNNSIQVGDRTVLIDSVDTANVEATVVARHGRTIAVGGLIRSEDGETREKVPVLGDIPVFGRLFRRDRSVQRKSEIILLVTPYVITDDGTAETRALMERLSDHLHHQSGDRVLDRNNRVLNPLLTPRPDEPQRR